MGQIDWNAEVFKRKDQLIADLQGLLKIKSVLNEDESTEDAPLGKDVKEALEYTLQLGEKDGFSVKNVGNLAGHIEYGKGKDLIGVLCHVDVVPEGDGWTYEPYGARIADGKIYARGAIDDKGPTMAAYYAIKILKELQIPIEKRIRMIIGTDEESDWRCVDHYFENEEMPTVGFAPDADFPIIHAEKGICDFDLIMKVVEREEKASVRLISFDSGRRYNMVPDYAKAVLEIKDHHTSLLQDFEQYLLQEKVKGEYHIENGYLYLQLYGMSAHGMEPKLGKNAGLLLAQFLGTVELDTNGANYVQFAGKYLVEQSRGEQLSLQFSDDITGELTINVGVMNYADYSGGKFGLNMRYPVTFPYDDKMSSLQLLLKKTPFSIENVKDSKPHYVPEDSEFIAILKKVYTEQTGEEAKLLSIGGGTYARALEKGVAFGALFPGKPDIAHQKDEYIEIEDLLKATAIYAQALYELTNDRG